MFRYIIISITLAKVFSHELHEYKACVDSCFKVKSTKGKTDGKSTDIEITDQCTCGGYDDKIQQLQKDVNDLVWAIILPNGKDGVIKNKINSCGVGIRDGGSIPDSWITASSYLRNSDSYSPAMGRLDKLRPGQNAGGWIMHTSREGEYIQVDLKRQTSIVGIVAQGRGMGNEYVKTYKVKYGTKPTNLLDVMNGDGVKIFQGNINVQDYAFALFDEPVVTRIIRIYPVTWIGSPTLRFELLTC